MIIRKSNLKLVPASDPILKIAPAEFVFDGETDPDMLANVLHERMKELGGVGLSANQVGLNIRMFTMGIEDIRIDVFNPVIISYTQDDALETEGCLSYPGIHLLMKRPAGINVKFQDTKGTEHQMYLNGLSARIFQHEYDHMVGTDMKARVSKLKWDMASKRLKNKKDKLIKKYTREMLQDLKKQMEEQGAI